MRETMLDLHDFIMGPSAWRKMSGPLALMTALLGGLFGFLFAGVGGLLLLQRESSPVVALFLLCSGLIALTSATVGVIAFLRANSGPT